MSIGHLSAAALGVEATSWSCVRIILLNMSETLKIEASLCCFSSAVSLSLFYLHSEH